MIDHFYDFCYLIYGFNKIKKKVEILVYYNAIQEMFYLIWNKFWYDLEFL